MVDIDLSGIPDDKHAQAKLFTDMIMENLVKDHVINYNDCYDHVYKIALEVGCSLIFRKQK